MGLPSYRLMFFVYTLYRLGKLYAEDYGECGVEMEQYRKCIKATMHEMGATAPEFTDEKRQLIEKRVKACFEGQNCPNPFPSAEIKKARSVCYQNVHIRTRVMLENCVKRKITGFTLPLDEDNGKEWKQAAGALSIVVKNANFCPWLLSKTELTNCLKRTAINRADTPTSDAQAICKLALTCGSPQVLTPKCRDRWEKSARPALCDCINGNRWLVPNAKQDYNKCIRNLGVFRGYNNDPNPGWLENGLLAWCPKVSKSAKTISSACPVGTVVPTTQNPFATIPTTQNPNAATPLGIETVSKSNLALETGKPDIVTQAATTQTIVITQPDILTTATLFPNRNFFNFLANNSFFQGLVGGQAGVDFLQGILTGQTDILSSLFPGLDLFDGNQWNVGNAFGLLGG